MINGIGKSIAGRIETARSGSGAPVAGTTATSSVGVATSAAGGTVASLIGDGAPVDTDKVASIKAAIAEGRYTIDAGKIAEAMLNQDLPQL